MSDYNEEEDARWLRAYQYLHRSGGYKLRSTPARTTFGLVMHWIRMIVERQEH